MNPELAESLGSGMAEMWRKRMLTILLYGPAIR
jgi:hypothetical protein